MSPAVPTNRSFVWVWVTILVACSVGLIGTYICFVEAPPSGKVVIATGSREGAYFRYASMYAELLKSEGIELELRETAGTVENLKLLADETSDVSLAFVQTGIAEPGKIDSLQSLCSLYREPLWIFYRGSQVVDRLTQFKGLRVAIGAEGSGTRGIALQLLHANGVNDSEAELHNIGGNAAAEALERNEIDAAFFVAGLDAQYVQRLIRSKDVRLVELNQIEAYVRQFRFLSTVTLHQGLIDLEHNIPAKDIVLIAPAATLVAHSSFHPTLTSLLLKAASKVHRGGDLLTSSGEFPSASFVDIPLSDEAERYFRVGPPVLQRILPFWLASMVDRMKVMIIPLIMLLMPLFRLAPPLVRWQTRRRIYLWYGQLRRIDQQAIHGMAISEARNALEELQNLEKQIAHVGVPLSYMEEYYNLRLHLNLVSSRVNDVIRGSDSEGGQTLHLIPPAMHLPRNRAV